MSYNMIPTASLKLPTPYSYGCPADQWGHPSFSTPLVCPAMHGPIINLLKDKFMLSKPTNSAQKAFQAEVESAITKATRSDSKVDFYFRIVLAYLPGFKIFIQDNISTTTAKGETVLAIYSASRRLLNLGSNGAPTHLINNLRHEMRHAFMHYVQLANVKKMTCSVQLFDETIPEKKEEYKAALNKDLIYIDTLVKEVTKGTMSGETKTAMKKLTDTFNNGNYTQAYDLLNSLDARESIKPGDRFNMKDDTSGNFIPARVIVQNCTYDQKSKLYHINYKFEKNNVFLGGLQLVKNINLTYLKPYPEENKLFERDAFLHERLPSFMIKFFYPHTSKLLTKFTDHDAYEPPSTIWPLCTPTMDISACELSAKRGTKAYLDMMLSPSNINSLAFSLEKRLNEPETVYALKYILSKPNANPRFKSLLAQALNIKYKNAGIVGYLTGANSVLLQETCKAYFHAYKAGTLAISDYIECLPLLKQAQDPHYKEMRQKALGEAQWLLQNTHPHNYFRIAELQQQILELNAMPRY